MQKLKRGRKPLVFIEHNAYAGIQDCSTICSPLSSFNVYKMARTGEWRFYKSCYTLTKAREFLFSLTLKE
jgi:hypothetical protein